MNPLLLAAWIACQSLDAGTTAVALRNPRLAEGNPLMRGPQMMTLKVSVNVGAFLFNRKLAKDRPASKAKYVLPTMLVAAGCGAGVLNIRTMGKVAK